MGAFLTAMLLGYEVVCRVGAAQTRATEIERGFDNPGVNPRPGWTRGDRARPA